MTQMVQGGTGTGQEGDTATATTTHERPEALWDRLRDEEMASEIAARLVIRLDELTYALRDCDTLVGVADWLGVTVDTVRARIAALTRAERVHLDQNARNY